jgi:hypothetical protein
MSPYLYHALYTPWFALAAGLAIFALVVGVGYVLTHRSRPQPPFRRLPAVEYGRRAKHADLFEGGRSYGERRSGLRRKGASIQARVADAEYHEFGMAWIMDRSTGGVALSMEQPLEPGTILQVRPQGASDLAGWVQVTVRSCQKGEVDSWKLGCQFERTPPWSVLLLFG